MTNRRNNMMTARFICKEGCLNIKFNGNCVIGEWSKGVIEELAGLFNTQERNVKFIMWSTDANDDAITFRIDIDTDMDSTKLSDALFRHFIGSKLFRITQNDIDNFTWNNNDYWIKLIDDIEEDMGRWLYLMLEGVQVQEIEN